MGNHPRKADGRRVFSTEFKRTTVQRLLTGEKTVAELSRELDIVTQRDPDLGAALGGRRRHRGRPMRTWSRPASCARPTAAFGTSSACLGGSRWRSRSWRRPGTS
jgi:hypothetical protein